MQKGKRGRKGKGAERGTLLAKSLKGALLALVVTALAVLVLALVAQKKHLPDNVILAVNQGIKLVCVILAALAGIRRQDHGQGLIGALAGALYAILGYLAFSLVAKEMGRVGVLLADMGMGAAVGMLIGLVFGRLGTGKQKQKKTA